VYLKEVCAPILIVVSNTCLDLGIEYQVYLQVLSIRLGR